jgi:hypothetical protein
MSKVMVVMVCISTKVVISQEMGLAHWCRLNVGPFLTSMCLMKMEKKQIEDDNRLKEVALKRMSKESEEKDATVQVLMNELDYIKRLDEEHSVSLENQKQEIELKSQEKFLSLEKQLQESQQQRHEMEVSFTEELSRLQKKDVKYKTCLAHQAYNVKVLISAT